MADEQATSIIAGAATPLGAVAPQNIAEEERNMTALWLALAGCLAYPAGFLHGWFRRGEVEDAADHP